MAKTPRGHSHRNRDIHASPLHAKYITRQEAADLLRVSPITVDTYVYKGFLTKYKVKNSSRVLYLREEVEGLITPQAKIPEGNYPRTNRRKYQPDAQTTAPSQSDVAREALKRFDEEGL